MRHVPLSNGSSAAAVVFYDYERWTETEETGSTASYRVPAVNA